VTHRHRHGVIYQYYRLRIDVVVVSVGGITSN